MRKASLLIACLGAVALAGCSSAADRKPTLPLPSKNLAAWTMPLDQYVYTTDFALSSDYAENLLISPCMEKNGYSFPVPFLNLDALHGPSFNDAGARLFNLELAQQYGYHVAPNPDPGAQQWREIRATSPKMSDAEFAVFSQCLKDARTQVHLLPQSAQAASSYANDAMSRASTDADVVAAAKAWRECMRPVGVSDLPASPLDMPSAGLSQRYGLNADGGSDKITQDELRVATADAQCQDDTGYRQKLYDATWSNQVEALRDNADDLKRSYDAIRKHRAEVAAVIAEHGPATGG
ncbi:MAG: hypothetical protein ACTHMF_19105 [Leifsonia sp.]|uniref:hypothetical protein n=1 Tax=Leifsonia sp. TaxID=1870902 RepID=UPI003F8202D9